MRSTVTGELVLGPELDAGYWVRNLRAPVLFSDATQRAMKDGHGLFVEMSPHPILVPAVEENLREVKRDGVALASVRRNADERRAMLEALGALYVRGQAVDWGRVVPPGGRCVSLPAYPWQRERFWLEPPAGGAAPERARRAPGEGEHPLLGAPFASSLHPDEHLWEQRLRVADLPYLTDHCVREDVVFPGAGYVEMALAAATEVFGQAGLRPGGLRVRVDALGGFGPPRPGGARGGARARVVRGVDARRGEPHVDEARRGDAARRRRRARRRVGAAGADQGAVPVGAGRRGPLCAHGGEAAPVRSGVPGGGADLGGGGRGASARPPARGGRRRRALPGPPGAAGCLLPGGDGAVRGGPGRDVRARGDRARLPARPPAARGVGEGDGGGSSRGRARRPRS